MRRLRLAAAVAVAAALLGAVSAQAQPTTRVVGGRPAAITDMPWVVYLEADLGKTNAWSCGGTIVGVRMVLTAAHCVIDKGLTIPASTLDGVAGRVNLTAKDGTEFHVARIAVNPRYNRNRSVEGGPYDAALLQTDVDLPYPAIALASAGDALFTAPGVTARIAGWGLTSTSGAATDVLMTAELPIVAPGDCAAQDAISSAEANVMVCAGMPQGGVDTCQGDSGGPLTTTVGADTPDPADDRQILVGVVSWGYECAVAGRPGLYTRITSLTGWLAPLLAGDETAWAAVADSAPPTVRARAARGAAGARLVLRYRVSGETGKTRETVTVRRSRGGTVLRTLRTVAAVNRAGADTTIAWRVPSTFSGRYVWCLTSRDGFGNVSPPVCAPLTVR